MSEVTTVLAPLTCPRAVALAEILSAAQQCSRVVFLDDDGNQQKGTARHIVTGPDDFHFMPRDQDVRYGYLRVTMQSGFERTALIADLIDGLNTTFFVYDWSK
ncbi:MAG: hypothetical protein WA988_20950 [Candidatus Nanopelagicales bacterium]